MTISAKVICDSVNPSGNRITTVQVRLPKFLLAEINTHRTFSRSYNSSRAIPAKTMRKSATFQPLEWGSNKSGMQAGESLRGWKLNAAKLVWNSSKLSATAHHKALELLGLHKQHTNRIIEPYMWVDGVVTATEWANFFTLRIHPDTQPEIFELAIKISEARSGSTPDKLEVGQYHLPYITHEDYQFLRFSSTEAMLFAAKSISAARCARVSYGLDKPFDIGADLKRASMLMNAVPAHLSPFEHVAMALDKPTPSANFIGWIQYRKQLEFVHEN